jgi:CRISPR-associated protein (TIGR02584 family)
MTESPRRILLSVTGLSPQVVTETLYALYKQQAPLPTEVHILTTSEGAERARLTLLKDRWFARFCQDYGLSGIEFDANHIHILQSANGETLADIRSEQDNQAMGDAITEWVRQFTADSHDSLHVSIAGGRKTMGFYAGYALSLFGRPQDRLSHVLVSADYESHPNFYYPTPYSHVIYTNDKTQKPLDTAQAEVTLAELPFVRLRHGLDSALLEGRASFSEAVAKAQQALGPASLQIDLNARRIIAQGTGVKLSPVDLAFYSWLARRQLQGIEAPKCPCDGAPELEYAEEYLREYRQISGELGMAQRTLDVLQDGMSKAFFEQRKARVNAAIKQALGLFAEAYSIQTIGRRTKTRHCIELSAEQISYL